MKANPADGFKSGDPNLIYSGEKVNLPGVTPKKATPKTNQEKLREAKNAERKAEAAKPAAKTNQEKLREARNAERKAEPTTKTNQEKLRDARNAERKAETVNKTETARDAAAAKRGPAAEPAPAKKFNPWTDTEEAKSWQRAAEDVNKSAKAAGEIVKDVADRVGRAGAEVAKGVGEGIKELTKPAPKSGKAGARKTKK